LRSPRSTHTHGEEAFGRIGSHLNAPAQRLTRCSFALNFEYTAIPKEGLNFLGGQWATCDFGSAMLSCLNQRWWLRSLSSRRAPRLACALRRYLAHCPTPPASSGLRHRCPHTPAIHRATMLRQRLGHVVPSSGLGQTLPFRHGRTHISSTPKNGRSCCKAENFKVGVKPRLPASAPAYAKRACASHVHGVRPRIGCRGAGGSKVERFWGPKEMKIGPPVMF
jgi:hypothetical protein